MCERLMLSISAGDDDREIVAIACIRKHLDMAERGAVDAVQHSVEIEEEDVFTAPPARAAG